MLHDGLLQNMTAEAVQLSFGPKAAGAWYLHQHSAMDDICHFVVFLSIAALFGSLGQTNYSASNSYLDSLVRLRCSKGLSSVSIQWYAIANVGMAARNEKRMKQSEQLSLSSMKKVFKQIFIFKVDREDTVRSPLPTALLQRDNFPDKMNSRQMNSMS